MSGFDIISILVTILGIFCLGVSIGAILENRQLRTSRLNTRVLDMEDDINDIRELIDDNGIAINQLCHHMEILQHSIEWESDRDPGVTQELPIISNTSYNYEMVD